MPAELDRLVQMFATAATTDADHSCPDVIADANSSFPSKLGDEEMTKSWSLD